MKYYVIYRSEDIGWYRTKDTLLGVTENEIVAKDFCNKFRGIYYVEAEVDKDLRITLTGIETRDSKIYD